MIEDERADRRSGLERRGHHVLRGSGAVLQHAVPDSEGPRSDAPRHQEAATCATMPEFNGTAEPPTTPATIVRDVEGARARRSSGRPSRRATEDAAGRRNAGRIGARRARSSAASTVEPGPRQPAGRRLVHRASIRSSRRSPSTRWWTSTSSRTCRSSSRARRTCSTGWTRSSRSSRRRSRTASRRWATTATSRTRCRSTTSRTSSRQRLDKLNDDVMRRETKKAQKEVALQPGREHVAGRPSPDAIPAIAQNPQRAGAEGARSRICSAAARAARGTVRREAARRCSQGERQPAGGAAASSKSETAEGAAVDQERLRHGRARRADARREPRRGEGRRAGPEPEERRLQRDGARGEEQPAGLRVAARSARTNCASSSNSRANNVRVDRSRRSAEGAR